MQLSFRTKHQVGLTEPQQAAPKLAKHRCWASVTCSRPRMLATMPPNSLIISVGSSSWWCFCRQAEIRTSMRSVRLFQRCSELGRVAGMTFRIATMDWTIHGPAQDKESSSAYIDRLSQQYQAVITQRNLSQQTNGAKSKFLIIKVLCTAHRH